MQLELTDYDVALEQFIKERGLNKKEFDKNIKEYGHDYVKYYSDRWHYIQANGEINEPYGF